MPVAPFEMQRIIANRCDINTFQAGWDASGNDLSRTGKFVNTGCACAILPQIPGRVRTEMAIIPCNIGLSGTHTFYKFWRYVQHISILQGQIQIKDTKCGKRLS